MDETSDNREARLALLRRQLRTLAYRAAQYGGMAKAPAEVREQIKRMQAEIMQLEADLAREEANDELALVGVAETPAERSLTNEINEITDPLLHLSYAASPQQRIVTSLHYVLRDAGPRQANVLRRCAIPRWFDADVLRVLRGKDDGNEHLLSVLASYSFVRPVNHTRFSYHDAVRAVLLQEWRDDNPDEFHAINQQLADYFQQRADHLVSPIQYAYRRAAYVALHTTSVDEWELCIREAIYHRIIVDPDAGMAQLRATFDDAEAAHRLGDAEALIRLTADIALPEAQQQWIQYLQARVDRAALRLDEAAARLNALREAPLEPLLAAKVQQTLGEVYAETGRWVQASELYRASLRYFQAHGLQRDAALMLLRLGEAYQEIARFSGGWHVHAYPQSAFWRSLGEFWNWLLAVPFFLVVQLLGNRRYQVPRPRILASYQNWLLTWVYRTAIRWFIRARAAYDELGDANGVLRAEQRLAEIMKTFGYTDEALERLNQLKQRVPQDDAYMQAWLDRDCAAVLLAQNNVDGARPLIAAALKTFHTVGDFRREASVLVLQNEADMRAGNDAAALQGYRDSLDRFRALHYTAAREQVLHDLRAWQRRIAHGESWEQIGRIIADEPEKRYVARFPRSQRPLLQLLALAALPLTMLLLALFAPQSRFELINRLVTQTTYYNPWAALAVLAIVVVVYSLIYTAIALGVIYLLPLDALKREQPDVIVTDPRGIARYDSHGDLALQIAWPHVRQWIEADFRLWLLPLPLFSATLLERTDDADLIMDGITGWYSNLQHDLAHHLQQAGNTVQRANRGVAVLRSKMGALLVCGLLLLLVFITAENGWADWLVALLPPIIYAALSLVAFSGVLMLAPLAYWFAARPLALRRDLDLHDAWPLVVMTVGLLSILIGLPDSGNPIVTRVPALNIGLLLWGAYLFADGSATHFVPRRHVARGVLIVAALLGVLVLLRPLAITTYLDKHNQSVQRRIELFRTQAPSVVIPFAASGEQVPLLDQPLASRSYLAQTRMEPRARADAYSDQGSVQYALGNYAAAVDLYDRAIQTYIQTGDINRDEELRKATAGAYYNQAQALRQLHDARGWQQALSNACTLYPGVASTECASISGR